ncbi:MAG: DUF3592 domain-containing protein, partial [Planctomycetota bacterium]
ASALKLLNEYPVGSRHAVDYNPEDPSSAILVPGSSSVFLICLMVGAVIIFFIALLAAIGSGGSVIARLQKSFSNEA